MASVTMPLVGAIVVALLTFAAVIRTSRTLYHSMDANEVTFASTSRGKEERSRIVKPFNLDDVCPDGSAAVELPASSPWRRKTKHPSCAPGGQKEHNERFVSYLPQMCKGDESSVVIYLNGENTETKGCMAASTPDCKIDMASFERLEADVRMKDCVGIWAAPLWQKPVFKAKGMDYNQGLSGEYDYLEICPLQNGGNGTHPSTNVGPAGGGWRGPTADPGGEALGFPREKWDKQWTAENNDDFAQHVTVMKNLTTWELWVQICALGTDQCQITPESARYGTDIRLSEIFTGTKNSDSPGGENNHPVPSDVKGKVELISDIWNMPRGEGCSVDAKPGATCRMSVSNLKVTGGLPNSPTCSKIMSAPRGGEVGHSEL